MELSRNQTEEQICSILILPKKILKLQEANIKKIETETYTIT